MAEQETLILTEDERRMVLERRERHAAEDAARQQAVDDLRLAAEFGAYLLSERTSGTLSTFMYEYGYGGAGAEQVYQRVISLIDAARAMSGERR